MRLRSLSLSEIEALVSGAVEIGGTTILPGALPPDFILARARTALSEGKSPLWHSPWLFLAEDSCIAVGTGGFKGAPASGRVEIGYGVAESCRGRGFAIRAVLRLVEIAREQDRVTEIYAETAIANVASRRVVEKCGFSRFGQQTTAADGVVDRWLKKAADG
jgi:RimJ/RimL family protein N-acetyltransferase